MHSLNGYKGSMHAMNTNLIIVSPKPIEHVHMTWILVSLDPHITSKKTY